MEMTTPEPPMLGYNVEIKIVNLGENYQAPKPGSEEYRQLSNVIENNLKNLFKRVPGYKKMIVENVIRYALKLDNLKQNQLKYY